MKLLSRLVTRLFYNSAQPRQAPSETKCGRICGWTDHRPAFLMLSLRPEQRLRLIQHMTLLLNIIICSVIGIVASVPPPRKDPEPYHTSILSGAGWVLELLTGHPDRIRNELSMHAELFKELVTILRSYGHSNSRSVSLEEQVAIFLYTCVTGLPSVHVGE